MPLFKRKTFPLAELPNDLEPHELVYQVRFTEEIFRGYDEYLNRINLYRQRVWMCKVSGKTNLTYEEALLSEERATEKVHQFPKELMEPALQIIQYSMLSLKDLSDMVAEKLQERLYVGAEIYGRKDDDMYPCIVSKIIEDDVGKIEYEVAWLDKNKEVIETSVINREDVIQKKLPFSRKFLKSFIRESTYRSAPWVLHDKLAQSYGISKNVPENLRSKVSFKDGLLVCNKRRKNGEEAKHDLENCKRKKVDGSGTESNIVEEGDEPVEEPIKYPIDDQLVQPDADDPVFTDRPSPSRDFNVPMECVGDLLMVWDFCSSFGRLLHLWPFSLEDFENAICHKKGNLVLLVETHSALLRLLIKDNGEYFSAVRERNRKLKITLITWTEFLCDFLEMINIPELCAYVATIKRGHYGLLDAHAKLGIFQELVNHALETNIVREKLDKFVEQRQALGATRREEALEEARKKRKEKERLRAESDVDQVMDLESKGSASENGNHIRQNGDIVKKRNGEIRSSRQDSASEKSASKQVDAAPKKMARKQKVEVKVPTANGNGKDLSEKEALERSRDDRKEVVGQSSKERRREYYEREIEKRFIRTNSLGKDRNHNRYWWFQRDGRIFVESSDSKQWGYYSSKEELYLLTGSLNCKGERERALKKQLEKFISRICLEIEKRSKDLAQRVALEEAVLRRSSRVRAPPRKNPANAFLEYVNKWKED
ncbi:hypothetical protein L3X38_025967 [Prunus dulcis]|uniref:DDT domain-containing protein n=1 Tax=Prunus dulcis TaxID=3755 RepID=A0AAD4W3V1_PRUDU|nr:hypothetical protein L3X38_025967 [Prunus dulcis]